MKNSDSRVKLTVNIMIDNQETISEQPGGAKLLVNPFYCYAYTFILSMNK